MRYYVNGDNNYKRYATLDEAIYAAKSAPWANGTVYDAGETTGGYLQPEETFPLLFSFCREE